MAEKTSAFTGRKRQLSTRRTVKFADQFAASVITVGGIGTIGAVFLVGVLLVWEVVPLFQPAEITPVALPQTDSSLDVSRGFRVDEYDVIGWGAGEDGSITSFSTRTGESISTRSVVSTQDDGRDVTAFSIAFDQPDIAFGFADGSVVTGLAAFKTDFLEAESVPEEVRSLATNQTRIYDGGIVEVTPRGQFRVQRVEFDLPDEPLDVADSPVTLIDVVGTSSGPVVAVWSEERRLLLFRIKQSENIFTGEVTSEPADQVELPVDGAPTSQPNFLLMGESGSRLYLIWEDGTLFRYSLDDSRKWYLAESLKVVPAGRTVTSVKLAAGRTTLLIGDSEGDLTGWFPVRDTPDFAGTNRPVEDETETVLPDDGYLLTRAHEYGRGPTEAAVSGLGPSPRDRTVAVGYADGSLSLIQTTNERRMVDFVRDGPPAKHLALTPQAERSSIYGVSEDHDLFRGKVEIGHPAASLAGLFAPIWYEGYAAPASVWQSTSASDATEPKFGLGPIIFGTLKATFYSMLFGAPLALMAAIYTSEIMPSRWRPAIKPTIENMASLPSVVLGYVAAIVIAPYVEKWLPMILLVPFIVPLALLTGAYLWQMLPVRVALRLENGRMFFAAVTALAGVFAAYLLGPIVEDVLFRGNILLWFSERKGSGIGGWFLILTPLVTLVVALLARTFVTPILINATRNWSRSACTAADLGKFAVAGLIVLAGTYLLSWALIQFGSLTGLDLDPRNSLIGSFDQRNAFIVGFVMGFAIIPIIFTLADDALMSVPQQLRSASLGSGATPWQTAMRVVLPTAMSGLFSALMVGLGRAVGETMIVLMAAGNTPILDFNIFNGFRTLSANIAVELPEAVKGSTHFRILFLCALLLFILTFIVNTVAEIVRIRFRKRASQL
ncbi:ABC transporter permease subunit [Stratiformator vulcanicus]|nr:ABC transporter permease subunit [Stratiformator vulcanicus]